MNKIQKGVFVYDTLIKLDSGGKPLLAVRVADITKMCSAAGKTQILLKFAHDEEGPLVQLTRVNDDAHAAFFHYKKLGIPGFIRDATFGKWASILGISSIQLAQIISECAPPVD
jgi:hypothetical protein